MYGILDAETAAYMVNIFLSEHTCDLDVPNSQRGTDGS